MASSWQHRDLAAVVDLPAEPVAAGPQAPIAEHVRAGLDGRLRSLIAHDPGTRLGTDPEELHQMRVSVRRMRAMLRAARPFLDESWAEPLRAELGWLGRSLGPVRDLDVLLDRLRQESADLPAGERAAAARLISGLEAEHGIARVEMLAALDSDRYLGLLRALTAAIRSSPEESDADSSSELRGLVLGEFRKLRKAVARLPESPADRDLHALRILGKRVRYTAELAQPVFGGSAQQLIRAARRFQDVLGEHQDACVAEERVRDLLHGFGDEVDAAVGFVAGRLVEREQARKAERRAQWRSAWDALSAAAAEV
ncbi:CHAD domain-containing protein [Saccharopolyspora kobensis]|uniref:CHAD domain-containing protein n=1 Tax=Saccharopolyspora kobensis TaxID=146035 RepID=A0A1H6CYJ7_9PSEU|nr:CHAD domain-containing protein [Saccharopolyspora kobensis]SEG78122.1 CHAD domain-containing protein [Saccharopolyspora kobensis]SFD04598.1 CHAD domain-containing protein [Saccharopolyspora kobensis]